MKATIASESFNKAIDTITTLIGPEADCILVVEDSSAYIETSSPEAWLKFPLEIEESEGSGKVFTSIQYISVVKPRTKSLLLTYDEGSDHIEVEMGRARGAIRVLSESEIEVVRPAANVAISAAVPVKLLKFATGATQFKPLLDASSPNAILEVEGKSLRLSSYDTYIGTHYSAQDESIKTKTAVSLVVEMDFWKQIIARLGIDGTAKMGVGNSDFRFKTADFDLYHALILEDQQDVAEVIDTLKKQPSRAVIEFDGKAATDAIESTKGIIKAGDKSEARYYITLKDNIAILSAESGAGEMEADFDVSGYDGDSDVDFKVSSVTFADTLKLTRDEGLKYGPVRLTVLDEYLVMESLKVPASSIAPVLQD